jgi:polyisoprenyl-phosphate glycosyltransferase
VTQLGKDVSIVLPVFNEEEHVHEELTRIRDAMEASPYSYEIIVVDDGSRDRSSEILRRLDFIRLIRTRRNRGSGSARKLGTQHAQGRVVVWTDVDMTYPNEEIPLLVKELEGNDQVVGARQSEQGTVKFLRTPAKWMIRKLAGYLVKTKIPDLNSGFRAFRREVGAQFLHMLPTGFSCVTTMTMAFLSNGYSVKYIPIDYHPRSGESKFKWRKDTQRYVLQVIRLIMSYDPLRIFVPVTAVLGGAAFGKLIYDLVANPTPFAVANNTIILFLAAVQVFVIGLLADLTVRNTKPQDEVPPEAL